MKVAVIGAGVAGLSTAARLAAQNIKVDIYDANPQVGGKMYEYTNEDGLNWDTGPTLISLPNEIRQTFSDIQHECPILIPLKENCHLNFTDGTNWKIPCGKDNVIELFSQHNPQTSAKIKEIFNIAELLFEFAEKQLFHECPPSLLQIGLKALKSKFLLTNSKFTLRPYENVVNSLIEDQNLREFFYHFASYIGVLPKYAQAGILSIAHVELGSEIVFPQGGVYAIAKALKNACHNLNVNFLLNHNVVNAQLTQNRSEWNISAHYQNKINTQKYDLIVSNCDPYVACQTWLQEPALKQNFTKALEQQKYTPSESQFVILYDWEDFSPLCHHTKIFPKSWKDSFEKVWLNKALPEDPCIYLVWPHATDPTISPRVLFISAMAPNTLSQHTWDDTLSKNYAQKILTICQNRLGLSFKGKIFKTVTPKELEMRAKGLYGGIYTAAYNRFDPTHFLFSGKTNLNNLYFVGSGVHPGAGVTMVMKSARRISEIILNNHFEQK